MGRANSLLEKNQSLDWARSYTNTGSVFIKTLSLSKLRVSFYTELRNYFALAALSRSTSTPKSMVTEAKSLVFRCRVILEKRIFEAISQSADEGLPLWLFEGQFYGFSKKQGTSVRMPLLSCRPTLLCAGACYAHDVLDAAPASIVRGAVNGFLADRYETGKDDAKEDILCGLEKHTHSAVKAAQSESNRSKSTGWNRRPYIRFSHVGEIAAYPKFANALAEQVVSISGGAVDCVIYTRHPNAKKLDPNLWVVNFTLDQSSYDRKSWVPDHARTVFSAFGGHVDPEASVNFLEHHRWVHVDPIGEGTLCPATLPTTVERTCDAVRCVRCFIKPQVKQ